ncbi:MAG: RNA polymerase sigma factor [Verrucomicrobiota bacterium]|nr:RNA polymerase sigma factor [Verrucomicrobiota bacterium]
MATDSLDADTADRLDMTRLATGDDGALESLMQRHGPAVYRLLLGLLQDPEEACDLAQETFVRLYQARGRFRSEDRLLPWLHTIALNLARNRLRWRRRHPTVSWGTVDGASQEPASSLELAASSEPSPLEQLQREERIRAVRQAVADLPPRLREVIVLCEWEERSQAEVATILRISPKAVESLLYRARRILRARLHAWL